MVVCEQLAEGSLLFPPGNEFSTLQVRDGANLANISTKIWDEGVTYKIHVDESKKNGANRVALFYGEYWRATTTTKSSTTNSNITTGVSRGNEISKMADSDIR